MIESIIDNQDCGQEPQCLTRASHAASTVVSGFSECRNWKISHRKFSFLAAGSTFLFDKDMVMSGQGCLFVQSICHSFLRLLLPDAQNRGTMLCTALESKLGLKADISERSSEE